MSRRDHDNWGAYFCMVEDRPASILVDLGLMRLAPLKDFPVLWHLGLSLQEPDENGLPGPEEYERLGRIDDALSSALQNAVHAGNSICDGSADFFFYLPGLPEPSPFLNADGDGGEVEAALAGYEWESGASRDPDWGVYKDFLFPGEYDMLGIQNRRAVSRLEQMGDEPALARAIEHWLDFPSPQAREQAAVLVREQGFAAAPDELPPDETALEGIGPDAIPDEPAPACLRLVRHDTLEALDDVVFSLACLADEYGGRYRGWACPPAREARPLAEED